jgi:cytoskeletal protein CcmA (bactofilin family)
VKEADNPSPDRAMQHLDEMTCLLYIERQLDRARAQEVSNHTQECNACRMLLRALERESRLLTRAMLEEEEALPARLAQFQERARRSLQWIWGVAFGLAATGVYALYTTYVVPLQDQLNQAGFGSTNLMSLLIFQGAFWKGWQSMVTLLEVLALVTLGGFGVAFFRRRLRRGSVVALLLAGLCAGVTLAMAPAAAATDFRKADFVEVRQDETVKGDVFLFGHRARVNGTVEGDVYIFAEDANVSGNVKGDVIAFAHTLHVTGQVDGNVRSFANDLTISGGVTRNVLTFTENLNLDGTGKVGGSMTVFAKTFSLDGHLGRDLLVFTEHTGISGTVAGSIRAKGDTLDISSSAQVDGPIRFEGDRPAEVSPQAKLASPVEYHKLEHKPRYRQGHYYIWRVIWTAAFVLFGMVLVLLAPRFATDTVRAAERYGAPIGLGVLVFFGVPVAALIACITVVGIPLGILAMGFWFLMVNCAELVVGTVVGNWILGNATDTWELIGRMALGFVLVRVVYTPLEQVHVLGILVGLGIWIWGMGAISLALYRQFQPAITGGLPSGPLAPPPLPPNTMVGGAQPA